MSPLVLFLLGLAAVIAVAAVFLLRRPATATARSTRSKAPSARRVRRDKGSVLEVESYSAQDVIARLDSTVADLSNLPAQLRRSRVADPVLPSDLQVILGDRRLPVEAMAELDAEFAPRNVESVPTLPEDLFAPGAEATPRRKVRLRPERVAELTPKPKDWSPQTGYEVDREPTWVELGLPEDVPETYLDDAFRA